jgi:hypothetical protein
VNIRFCGFAVRWPLFRIAGGVESAIIRNESAIVRSESAIVRNDSAIVSSESAIVRSEFQVSVI